jgi:hypothetical protein
MKNASNFLLCATLLSAVACGNNNDSKSVPVSQNLLLSQAGHYQATLSPINAHLAGDVAGSALVKVKGDSLTVEVKVNGSPAQISHGQSIHIADSCPTLSSDINKDGVIDGVEGQKSYGPVIIPLDSDLRTQIEKDIRFPTSDFSGNYYYRQQASISEMMKDLTEKDFDTTDNLIKIKSSLGLAGRQVVIYGVASDVAIPESVNAINGQTKSASLPIACGTLIKIAVDEGTNSNGGKD